MEVLFIAKEKFGPQCGERWNAYVGWAKIPDLKEIISLDTLLCPDVVGEIRDADWDHIVNEDFRLAYFRDLEYLLERIGSITGRNVLGIYRNPDRHVNTPPANRPFVFIGYDLIEDMTRISALTDCGGFPETFSNDELNRFGLISGFDRAKEIQQALPERNPDEPHARCELYAIWRMVDASPIA